MDGACSCDLEDLDGRHDRELVVRDGSLFGNRECVGTVPGGDRVTREQCGGADGELRRGGGRGIDEEGTGCLDHGAVAVAQDHGVQSVGTRIGVEGHVAGTRGDKHVDRAHVCKGVVGDVPVVGDDQGVDSVPAEDRVGGEKIDVIDRDKRAGGVGGIGGNRPGGLAQRAVAVAEDHGREAVGTRVIADGDVARAGSGEDLHAGDVGKDIVADLTLVVEGDGVGTVPTEDRVGGEEFDRVDRHRDACGRGSGDGEGSGRLENLAVTVAEDDVLETDITGGVVSEGDRAGTGQNECLEAGLVGEGVVPDLVDGIAVIVGVADGERVLTLTADKGVVVGDGGNVDRDEVGGGGAAVEVEGRPVALDLAQGRVARAADERRDARLPGIDPEGDDIVAAVGGVL